MHGWGPFIKDPTRSSFGSRGPSFPDLGGGKPPKHTIHFMSVPVCLERTRLSQTNFYSRIHPGDPTNAYLLFIDDAVVFL